VLVVGVAFYQVVLAVHIMAVVVAFGVTFAYPLFDVIGHRLDPRAIPWYHRMQVLIGQRLISPGLAVVLIAGIYLASKLHQWGQFYVQWGLAVAIVLGALGGLFFAPRERRLAELAERDLSASAGPEVTWSEEYLTTRRLNAIVGSASSLLVLVTVYLMTVQS
jgi:Predicted integral membrane protein (DUF2269)